MTGNYVHNKFLEALHFVFPKNCFEEIILNFNILHKECAPMVVSRALGLAITAGSMMLLLPQILKIFAAKSGRGISLISQFLALLASSGTAAYSFKSGFVFSQWGDSLFVSLQTAVIIMQILYYSPRRPYAFAFLAFVWSGYLAIVGDYVPFHVLTTIQTLTIPITVISKVLLIFFILKFYNNYYLGNSNNRKFPK